MIILWFPTEINTANTALFWIKTKPKVFRKTLLWFAAKANVHSTKTPFTDMVYTGSAGVLSWFCASWGIERLSPVCFNKPLHFLCFPLHPDVSLELSQGFIQLHAREVHLIYHTAAKRKYTDIELSDPATHLHLQSISWLVKLPTYHISVNCHKIYWLIGLFKIRFQKGINLLKAQWI